MDADRAVDSDREMVRSLLLAADVSEMIVDVWVAPLSAAAYRFDIVTDLRRIHWIATLAHESAGLTQLEENLNYSARALVTLWPMTANRPWGFTPQEAADYARQPEMIANRVYADRMGNGNEASGEGWLYRGRGPIQITGRENYEKASIACDRDLLADPESLLEPDVGAKAAGWYWQSRGCNQLADADNTEGIRRKVNGGTIGLQEVAALVDELRAA